MKIVLASGSPRRIELIQRLDVDCEVQPARIDEETIERQFADRGPEGLALAVARAKAEAVFEDHGPPVLAADTVVWVDGRSLGKPADARAALEMVLALRGREHLVTTGVVLLTDGGRLESAVTASVVMRPASRSELEAYVASGEPLDKAGGYGIQGLGARLISGVQGCYLTVVGFPLCAVTGALAAAGLPAPDPLELCRVEAQATAGRPPFALPGHPPVPRIDSVPSSNPGEAQRAAAGPKLTPRSSTGRSSRP